MGYEAVLFDMDGVLIDTHQSVTVFWQKYAAIYDVHFTQTDWEQHTYGCPASYTLDVKFPHLSPAQRQALMDDLADYEANLTYTAIEGVITFLGALKQNNIPTALVTSGDRWKVKEVTGQLGLTGVFAATITVNDIRRGKPDPECYLLAAQALQKLPERCLVFEDSISGVKAATAAGTFCIGVQSPQFAGSLYQAGAGYVAPDFNGVRLATGGGDSPTSIQLYLDAEHCLPLHID